MRKPNDTLTAGGENQTYPSVEQKGYVLEEEKAGGWDRTNDLPLTRRLLYR